MNSISKYIEDIEALCDRGVHLKRGLYNELITSNPDEFHNVEKSLRDAIKDETFKDKYHSWYNESLCLIKQLMPDRLPDFVAYYKMEKRKSLNSETYTVSDYLVGLSLKNHWGETTLSTSAVWPKFEQQVAIVTSLKTRFSSSLYDIRQLLQAEVFDSEIAAAKELLEKGFLRAAGAVTGVVLERHLSLVCQNHSLVLKKKAPSINDYNQFLKDNDVIDTPTWRNIQFLGDLRNLCDHGKERDPKLGEIEDLISGTTKIMKTVF